MEREKMIEEIENILFEYDCHEVSAPWVHIKYAHEIIDAIIPEGSVVLTKEEYVKFKKNVRENEFYALYNEIDQARKETAKQSCDDLIKIIKNNTDLNASVFGWTTDFILNMIKAYFKEKFGVEGVEVE